MQSTLQKKIDIFFKFSKKVMGFIGKKMLWCLLWSLENPAKINKKKNELKNQHINKRNNTKWVKNTQKEEEKNSPLVIESLVFDLWPTHGKEGRGSTIPTKETRATTTQQEQCQELG